MKRYTAIMMLLLIACLMAAMFAACTPQKRLSRILKKHPELISSFETKVLVKDSIYEADTFFMPGFIDSFQIGGKDTTIKKPQYQISKGGNKYKLEVYPDTLYQLDTTYLERILTIPGKVIDLTPHWWNSIRKNGQVLAFLTLSLALITLIFKRKAVD